VPLAAASALDARALRTLASVRHSSILSSNAS
jgi:hypothetical protein